MEIYRFGKMEIWKNGNKEKGNQDKGKFGKMKLRKNGNLEKWKF